MSKQYLDKTGLAYFWGKIKTAFIPASAKGAAGGVCPLNASGKIDPSYLPGFYDVPTISGTNLIFPTNYLVADGNNDSYGTESSS